MKVVLDTNVLFNDWELRKPAFQLLCKYAQLSGAVSIVVPEIVFQEAVANYKEQVRKQFDVAERAKSRLGGFGVREALQPAMKPAAEASELAAKDYSTRLRRRIDEVAVSPDHIHIHHQDLLDRCFSGRRPFRDSGKGYRDSLIWEVLLSVVASNEDVTYFVTHNHKDFAGDDDKSLHPDLVADVKNRGIKEQNVRLAETLDTLVEEQVKPNLHSTDALPELKSGVRGPFRLEAWFQDCRDDIGKQIDADYVVGQLCAAHLDEPTVAYVEDPTSIEVSDVYELDEERAFVDVNAIVEIHFQFFIAKNEYYLHGNAPVEIEDANWNEWVMLAGASVELRLGLSLVYNAKDGYVENFEVLLPEIYGFCLRCHRPEYRDAAESCSSCGRAYF